MITKVVYIGYQPLTEKVIEDFYFEHLIQEKIAVAYWDLSEIYFPSIFKNDLDRTFIVKIKSFAQLKECLQGEDVVYTLFISLFTFEYRVLNLYRLLSKYNCKTAFFARGALPVFSQGSKARNQIVKLKKVLEVALLVRFVRNRYATLLKKLNIVFPHAIVFRAGVNGIQTIGAGFWIDAAKAKIIEVNSFDFDKHMAENENEAIFRTKYCVYLDEYLPYHPDFKMLNIKTIDPSPFYNKLNDFFEFIEKKYNLEVVIAAHPKSEKYKEQDFFNNRKVFFKQTANLTQHAEFVLAHCSSSISFAVLNNKPVLFLVNDEIQEIMPQYYNFIDGFSNTLGSSLINIDKDFKATISISKPCQSKYGDYKNNYLTSQKSEMQISSEIFIKNIRNL